MINKRLNLTFTILFLLCPTILCACQSPHEKKNSIYKILSKDDPGNNHYKGHYKVGKQYQIKNKTYNPKEVTKYNKVGIASWK